MLSKEDGPGKVNLTADSLKSKRVQEGKRQVLSSRLGKSKLEDISKRPSRYKSKWGTFPRGPPDKASLNGGHFLLSPLSVSLSLAPCLHLHFISISPPPSISIFLPSSLLFCFSFPSPASFLLPFLCSFFLKEMLIILDESNRNASDD